MAAKEKGKKAGSKSAKEPAYPGLERLGDYIKAQRKMMELSQRELAKLTQLSDPYVSQLERGLHEPSVRVLKALSGALNVRAETLLAYAGLLDPEADESSATVVEAIQSDPHLTDDQKLSLIGVYRNFRATSVPLGEDTDSDDA